MEEELESGIIKIKKDPTHRRLDIRVRVEVANDLKKIAKHYDRTVTSIIKELINNYIKEHK